MPLLERVWTEEELEAIEQVLEECQEVIDEAAGYILLTAPTDPQSVV